jgi:competence protein ComEC
MGLLVLAAFCAGFTLAGGKARQNLKISVPLDSKKVMLCQARVKAEPVLRSWGARVDVDLEACGRSKGGRLEPAGGGVRLSIFRGGRDLVPGDRIRFRARFYQPREYHNPGSFRYRRYLMTRGIAAGASTYGRIRVMSKAPVRGPSSWIRSWRRKINDLIASIASEPESGVLAALAIGRRDGISSDLRDTFARAGIAHLLAISGLHVGYAALLIYLLARLILGFFPRLLERFTLQRMAALAALPGVWIYVALTGSSISAVRAALMITVYLVGKLAWRRQHLPSTLAAAVVVIVVAMPLSVLDVSFQLSVVAVLGIILLVPPIISIMMGRDFRRGVGAIRVFGWFKALVAVSVAACLVTAPLVAYHFHLVTAAGLVANLAAVPLVGFVLVPAIGAASIVSLISASWSVPLWHAARWASSLLIEIAEAASRWGHPLVLRWAPSVWEVLFVYACMATIVFWRHLPYRRFVAASLAALMLMGLGYQKMPSLFHKNLEIVFLDVGQGDSTVVRFPTGEVMLVDGGGIKGSIFDVGRNVVAPALWRLGIHKVDWMLLTHPHHDHYRGLGYIAEQFGPKVLWASEGQAPEDERGDWDEFVSRREATGVPVEMVGPDRAPMEIGGVSLRMIRLPDEKISLLNDSSIVVDMRHGVHRFLMMSDLTGEGERMLMDQEGDLSATVLKVGHHGAADATTSGFLHAVHPEVAIISVGEGNKYGMPASEVLDRLQREGARIYRTDRDGAITIRSEGRKLRVKTVME